LLSARGLRAMSDLSPQYAARDIGERLPAFGGKVVISGRGALSAWVTKNAIARRVFFWSASAKSDSV